MNREEFLAQLKTALSLDMSTSAIQDQLNYYSNYMDEEVAKGRSEDEVLAELGDPTLIAKTIVDVKGMHSDGRTTGYSTYGSEQVRRSQTTQTDSYTNKGSFLRPIGLDTWWKKALAVASVVGVIAIVIAIISGILSLVAPFIVPILIIVIVLRIFGNRR